MKTWTFKVDCGLSDEQIKQGYPMFSPSEIIGILKKKTPHITVSVQQVLAPTFTIEELENMGLLPKT